MIAAAAMSMSNDVKLPQHQQQQQQPDVAARTQKTQDRKLRTGRLAVALALCMCGLSHFCEPYVDPSLSTGSYTAAMKEPHNHKTLSVSVTIINYLTFTYKMTREIGYILLSRLR